MISKSCSLNEKIFPHKTRDIDSVESEFLERELCKESITLLKNNGTLPLNNLFNKKMAYVHIGDGNGDSFFNSLNIQGHISESMNIDILGFQYFKNFFVI